MDIDGAQTSHPGKPTACDGLWFPDGNVVLQAENLRFKVYQGILSRESLVFRDMFSLPQPSAAGAAGETCDECPLVRLSDKAEEIKPFLLVVFDPNFLDEVALVEDHIVILDIATKYQAFRVVRRVMLILDHHFPNTLSEYDHWMACNMDTNCISRTCECDIDAADLWPLFDVARRSGMRVLLPAAYLTAARLVPGRGEALEHVDHGLRVEQASSIIVAQRNLDHLARTRIFADLYGPNRDISAECVSPEDCHKARHRIIRDVAQHGEEVVSRPFMDIERGSVRGLCVPCRDTFLVNHAAARKEAWEILPTLLGLGTWEELRAARSELLGEAN